MGWQVLPGLLVAAGSEGGILGKHGNGFPQAGRAWFLLQVHNASNLRQTLEKRTAKGASIMRYSSLGSVALWFGAASAAVGLGLVAPTESALMGQLPPLAALARDQSSLVLPQQLPAERTLAVLVFKREQKEEARSWIEGMGLRHDPSIPWLKVRVVPAEAGPVAVTMESSASKALPAGMRPDRLLSVSTDTERLVQAMGLSNADHAQVVVLGRDGQVLAKAQGTFDQDKARALMETLRSD